jgi:hypothetical protein
MQKKGAYKGRIYEETRKKIPGAQLRATGDLRG